MSQGFVMQYSTTASQPGEAMISGLAISIWYFKR